MACTLKAEGKANAGRAPGEQEQTTRRSKDPLGNTVLKIALYQRSTRWPVCQEMPAKSKLMSRGIASTSASGRAIDEHNEHQCSSNENMPFQIRSLHVGEATGASSKEDVDQVNKKEGMNQKYWVPNSKGFAERDPSGTLTQRPEPQTPCSSGHPTK